jgi:pimeloyl-ACP methyl ester carboxylesterase
MTAMPYAPAYPCIKRTLVLLALSLLLSVWSNLSHAKTIVLIHGFQSNGMEWRFNGVTPVLQQYGWLDGGHYIPRANGVYNAAEPRKRPLNVFYTLMLPHSAPIELQSQWLDKYLQQIAAIRREPLILVGHSAGGVVARHWLVTTSSVPVSTLVTIAAPHLGTPLADLSAAFAETPLGKMATDMGFGALTQTPRALYEELRTEEPGHYLYWLNHQPHPPIRYVAIVRANELDRPDNSDFFVPPYSQDMNNVWALQGHVEARASKGAHLLNPKDGYLLASSLR